jgi:hypothetical protein
MAFRDSKKLEMVDKFKYPNGDIYEGEAYNKKRHGIGKLTETNGVVYEGQWTDNIRDGFGTETLTTGEKYQGQWANDKRDGLGICTYSNGDWFDGKWSRGERVEGKYTFADGSYFDGKWKAGAPLNGTLNSKKGKYSGQVGVPTSLRNDVIQYRDIKRHGRGSMVYPNGDKFIGQWKNNHKEGYGIYIEVRGNKYYGSWRQSKKNGFGYLIYNDGTCFEGDFNNDIKSGKGTMYLVNGDVINGEWREEQIIRASYKKGKFDTIPKSMRALLAQRLHESSQKEEKVDHSSYTKWNGSARMDNLSLAGEHLNLNETNFLTEVTKLFTEAKSPFNRLVDEFAQTFNWNYQPEETKSVSAANKREWLLPSAIDDINSFIEFMVKVTTTALNIELDYKFRSELHILLTDTLFPKIYDTLMHLYKAKNHSFDIQLAAKYEQLKDITPADIGINPKYWLRKNTNTTKSNDSSPKPTTPTKNSPMAFDKEKLKNLITVVPPLSDRQSSPRVVSDREDGDVSESDLGPRSDNSPIVTRGRSSSLSADLTPTGSGNISPKSQEKKLLISSDNSRPLSQELQLEAIAEESNTPRGEETPVEPYEPVIQFIRQLSLEQTPLKKLRVLFAINNAILKCVDQFYNQTQDGAAPTAPQKQSEPAMPKVIMGAEDKFPVLIYAVVKSQAKILYSECHFLSDFINELIANDPEALYRINELFSAVKYVLDCDPHVRDHTNCLTPVNRVEDNVSWSLKEAAKIHKDKPMTNVMQWLATFFKRVSYEPPRTPSIKLLQKEIEELSPHFAFLNKVFKELRMTVGQRKADPTMYKISFNFIYPTFVYSRVSDLVLQFAIEHNII